MNGKPFKRFLPGWIGILIILAVHPATRAQVQPKNSIDPALAATILNTTVQIRLYAPKQGSQTVSGERPYILAESLGTLATWQGDTIIVTHNHWGILLNQAEVVYILDAHGNILHELSGNDFRELIRYRDAGTLILSTPPCRTDACHPFQAPVGDSRNVGRGDLIVFVHQARTERQGLILHTARVISLTQYKDLTVIKMRSLDGQKIILGDSGGGIWADGYLVGNIWGRLTEQTGEAGYAARFPLTSFSALSRQP